jgi:hypothetical protein
MHNPLESVTLVTRRALAVLRTANAAWKLASWCRFRLFCIFGLKGRDAPKAPAHFPGLHLMFPHLLH